MAAKYVLNRLNGNISVAKLGQQLISEYPKLFAKPKKALNFVKNLVVSFG